MDEQIPIIILASLQMKLQKLQKKLNFRILVLLGNLKKKKHGFASFNVVGSMYMSKFTRNNILQKFWLCLRIIARLCLGIIVLLQLIFLK